MDYLLASAFITNSNKLTELKKIWAKRDKKHSAYLSKTQYKSTESTMSYGGAIYVFDANNLQKGFIGKYTIKTPLGMAYNDFTKSLYLDFLFLHKKTIKHIDFLTKIVY